MFKRARHCQGPAKLAPRIVATYTERVKPRAPRGCTARGNPGASLRAKGHWGSRTVYGSSLALVALLLSACGGAGEAPADGNASLEAVLSIERVQEAGREESRSASALAEFVILPSELDVHDTLGAAGLRSQLPEKMGCSEIALGEVPGRSNVTGSGATGSAASRRFNLRQPLELLEAGEVSIQAEDTVTRLALNLFPPSGSASGVIYTTPDQSADALPPNAAYSIRTTGSGVIPPLTIDGHAPAALADATIGGVPFQRAQTLSAGQPIDLTWGEGSPGDRVSVELADNERSLFCTFADEDGSGTLSSAVTSHLTPGSTVHLSLHRVREAVRLEAPNALKPVLEGAGLDNLGLETTVRFDFEVTAALRVE
jgi:hypothetical protein